jgi:alpha-beta hydrolase superfamily lysophospholipase
MTTTFSSNLKNITLDSPLKNIDRSDEFVVNDRGQKLHCNSFEAKCEKPLGYLIFLHGYGAHSNRPTHKALSNHLTEAGYTYIGLDFHGHGYSEGERGYVEEFTHLLDDVFCLLISLYSTTKEKNASNLKCKRYHVPFYLIGHSMGGGISLMTSIILNNMDSHKFMTNYISENTKTIIEIVSHFKGQVLFCPLVQLSLPLPVIWFVVNPLSFFLPQQSFPNWIINENDYNHLTWANEDYRKYIVSGYILPTDSILRT